MQNANILNAKIYTNYHDHLNPLNEVVSKIVIDRNSKFNRNNLKTILADCSNATIIQK